MKRLIMVSAVVVAFMFFLLGSTVMAQDFCEGNFNYDKDVDGSDASIFKEAFGRSALVDPCPADGPAPVPKTGQTIRYHDYDDGYYWDKGVAWPNPRFTDNLNGTVTDNLTGLIWLEWAACNGTANWTTALGRANVLRNGECGLSDGSVNGDWRLPTVNELRSLIDFSQYNPAISAGHPFVDVQTAFYWSSTTLSSNPNNKWMLFMGQGYESYDLWSSSYYVWPVRGGRATREELCGNNILDPFEECDGNLFPPDKDTCEEWEPVSYGGYLICMDDCRVDSFTGCNQCIDGCGYGGCGNWKCVGGKCMAPCSTDEDCCFGLQCVGIMCEGS